VRELLSKVRFYIIVTLAEIAYAIVTAWERWRR